MKKQSGSKMDMLCNSFSKLCNSIVWIAKYNQVSANGKGMTEAQVQKEAIAQADSAVRTTQDSLLPEDEGYQIGEPWVKAVMQLLVTLMLKQI